MVWDYSEKTTKLFMDAVQGKPGTHMGEIPDADGVGEHGSITCGDAMKFSFRVHQHPSDPLRDVITDAKYLTFGCTSAIASSEALCALIERGEYTPIGALKITNQDIVEYLEGLPQQKLHCSVMGADALEAAVFNWAQKRGVDLKSLGIDVRGQEEEGRVVCECFNLTEPYLKRKIAELGLKTVADVTDALKAGGACGSCQFRPGGIQDLLEDIWGAALDFEGAGDKTAVGENPPALSPFKFAKKVESVVEEHVRPMLKRDGGDIEIVDIKDMIVYCSLKGACAGCMGSAMTLKLMVERVLKEHVDERVRVIAV